MSVNVMTRMTHPAVRGLFAAAGFALWAPPHTPTIAIARVEFVVVVNDSNPMLEIDRDGLSRIFLKRSTSWPSGRSIQPVDLPIEDGSRNAFSRVVLHKSINAVRAYWQQQIFSGRDVPPAEKSEADLLSAIKSDGGAIGYVSPTTRLPIGVKRITVSGIDD